MRNFSTALRTVLEQWSHDDTYIVLVTITHEDMSDIIRVANNNEDVISNGHTYIGFPFDISIPQEDDSPPKGVLTVQNVDKRIGQAIEGLKVPPRIKIEVVLASDPDDVWLEYKNFWLRDAQGDAAAVSGVIDTWDFLRDIWPARLATKDRCPGLFR